MVEIPIRYEDQYLLIVDKPAGLIVHEGAGHTHEESDEGETAEGADPMGTDSILLTDWLKAHQPQIIRAFANEPADLYFRPGIVHRLDKDTSGLLIIAKTPAIKTALQTLFKDRSVTKHYIALVLGRPDPAAGQIETTISRDPHHRRQMSVSFTDKGKLAQTEYRTTKSWGYRYKGQSQLLSLVSITLHSGRMHQIRVHLKYKGWPIIGDQTYKTKPSRNISKELGLDRQFLHAEHLEFKHPVTGEAIVVMSPLPTDLQRTIDTLETNQ